MLKVVGCRRVSQSRRMSNRSGWPHLSSFVEAVTFHELQNPWEAATPTYLPTWYTRVFICHLQTVKRDP